MRHTLVALLVLCFFSCQKTENTIEEIKEIPTNLNSSDDYRDQAVIGNTLSKDFFSLLLSQSLSNPEIFGLQNSNQVAETRNCPTATSSGTTFPITITLDFGPAPGCTPQFFTLPKVGQITTVCYRKMFTTGTDADFTISLSEDYQEQGYKIIGGDGNGVVFKFKFLPNQTSYQIAFENDVILESLTTGNTITIEARPNFSEPFGVMGFIPDSGAIEDDPHNPFTYLDNVFYFKIFDSKIACSNINTTQEFCLDITSDSGNGIEFQPLECHCILSGVVRINEDSDCTASNTNANADVIYDFGNGDCDEEVDVTQNGITTTRILYNCL